MPVRQSIVTLALSGLLVLASCGSPDSGGAERPSAGRPDSPAQRSPDAPVQSTPGPQPSNEPAPKAQAVEPQDGLVAVQPGRWERAEPVGDDRLRLYFWDGVEECYGVDRVEFEYQTSDIVATIFRGRNPKAQVCIEKAVYKSITVDLDEPVDGRKVVDGARSGKRSDLMPYPGYRT